MTGLFPEDSAARKEYPVYSGLVAYFPSALAAVAHHSYLGNEKHNPGQPLHWARGKSSDEADALLRHLMERDYVGMAWRALALLQKHLEANGAPIAPGARIPPREDQAAAPNASYEEQAVAHHAIEAPMEPPIMAAVFADPERDDDEGTRGEMPRGCE